MPVIGPSDNSKLSRIALQDLDECAWKRSSTLSLRDGRHNSPGTRTVSLKPWRRNRKNNGIHREICFLHRWRCRGRSSRGEPVYTWGQMVTEINTGVGAGIRYNVKADGTYTRSAFDSMWSAVGGTVTSPLCIRGYKTVIGDGYLGRDATGALITSQHAANQLYGRQD